MNNPWLSRFAGVPAMVSPERRDEFEASLIALAREPLLAEAMAVASGADTYWTELGRLSGALRPYVVADGVLTIPVRGVLLNDFPYQLFGYATGYGYIAKAMERGLDDGDVKGIAFVVNSSGGEVAGNFDLVDAMFAARGQKPMRAYAAEGAYSAAYSIASAADSITVSRTGGVGSIGILTTHVDVSAAMEAGGVKVTFIYAGAHKVDGNSMQPLPDTVKARIQERVDAIYQMFVGIVARNRKMSEQAVRGTEAMTFMAGEAVSNGLADKIGSLDSALAEFAADLNNPSEGDETMETMTLASLRANSPELAKALIDEGKAAGVAEAKTSSEAATKSAVDIAVAAALKTDRERMAALDALGAKSGAGAKDIVAKAKAEGSSAEATALAIMNAGAHLPGAAAAALIADEKAATGATPAAASAGSAAAAVPQTKEGWTAEYNASDKLKAEFASADDYAAFKAADARGGVKFLRGREAA